MRHHRRVMGQRHRPGLQSIPGCRQVTQRQSASCETGAGRRRSPRRSQDADLVGWLAGKLVPAPVVRASGLLAVLHEAITGNTPGGDATCLGRGWLLCFRLSVRNGDATYEFAHCVSGLSTRPKVTRLDVLVCLLQCLGLRFRTQAVPE